MELRNISKFSEDLRVPFPESTSTNNENNENVLNNATTKDHSQKNRTTSLSIDDESRFIRNDFGKEYDNKNYLSYEIFDASKHKQPIMGKTALLKRNSIESTDSAIIQSIILNKYENILNYYVDRMYTRRISRVSTNADDEIEEVSSLNENSPEPEENNDKFHYVESTNSLLNEETTKDTLNDSICSEVDVTSTCSEYDPRKFLVDALGEAASSNNLNSCQFDSNMETCEESVGTSAISSLLSGTSFGSSLKRILKRNKSKWTSRTDFIENENMDFNENKKRSGSEMTDSVLDQCKMELSKQHSIIFQTSKALNYCKSLRNFIIGKERIEAERILLIATITKEALVKELNAMEFDSNVSAFDPRCTAEITLSNIISSLNNGNTPKKSKNCEEQFVVVIKCGKTVFDSGVMDGDDKTISIQKTFKFSKLHRDFEITLAVYSLHIINEDYMSQDSRCPSPKSLIKCNNKYSKSTVRNSFIQTETPSFSPIGKCSIKHSDLSKIGDDGILRLKWDHLSSHILLQSFVNVDVRYTFKLSNKLTGFLTVGLENGIITWNRRWCALNGFQLRYWNYPSDESSIPIEVINLKYCAEQKISLADRSACARPKTLYLPLRDSRRITKYFLSADNQSDLNVWESELNFVVRSLSIWNGMETDSYS